MSKVNLLVLTGLLDKALAAGATAADAYSTQREALSVTCRNGLLEVSTREESLHFSLRVFIGNRQASVSSTALEAGSIDSLIEKAVSYARLSPEDPFKELLPAGDIFKDPAPDLQTLDDRSLSVDDLRDLSLAADDAAMAVAGVTRSAGASASTVKQASLLVTSNGFAGEFSRSAFAISSNAIAGNSDGMERGMEFSQACHLSDLMKPEAVGAIAGGRAVERLGGKSMKSGSLPVVFAPRIANSLLSHLATAVSGSAVAMKTSFLQNSLGEQVFRKGVQVIDDARRIRGLGSRPFDAEGAATGQLVIVNDGVLKSWILDHASARQLGLNTNGHAQRRGAELTPGTFNLYLAAGSVSPDDLISDIKHGLYVTSLIGSGVNGITGDYSRGSSGFLIENGQITTPVKGTTIAGNLKEMFMQLTPADDLAFERGTDSPTVRIDNMSIAGL